jgi:hypothetical protein
VSIPKTKNDWLDIVAREIGLAPPPTLEELRLLVVAKFKGANLDVVALHRDLFGGAEEPQDE